MFLTAEMARAMPGRVAQVVRVIVVIASLFAATAKLNHQKHANTTTNATTTTPQQQTPANHANANTKQAVFAETTLLTLERPANHPQETITNIVPRQLIIVKDTKQV